MCCAPGHGQEDEPAWLYLGPSVMLSYGGFQISAWESRTVRALPGSLWPSRPPLPEGEGE
jgi:hypothetical protein